MYDILLHSHEWHDLFICESWLFHLYGMTRLIHIYGVTRLFWMYESFIHMCDMTYSYVSHDSFIYTVWHDSFIYTVWHDYFECMRASFTCVTWLIHIWVMTHSYIRYDTTIFNVWELHSHAWHAWLIHIWVMTHSYMRLESSTNTNELCHAECVLTAQIWIIYETRIIHTHDRVMSRQVCADYTHRICYVTRQSRVREARHWQMSHFKHTNKSHHTHAHTHTRTHTSAVSGSLRGWIFTAIGSANFCSSADEEGNAPHDTCIYRGWDWPTTSGMGLAASRFQSVGPGGGWGGGDMEGERREREKRESGEREKREWMTKFLKSQNLEGELTFENLCPQCRSVLQCMLLQFAWGVSWLLGICARGVAVCCSVLQCMLLQCAMLQRVLLQGVWVASWLSSMCTRSVAVRCSVWCCSVYCCSVSCCVFFFSC